MHPPVLPVISDIVLAPTSRSPRPNVAEPCTVLGPSLGRVVGDPPLRSAMAVAHIVSPSSIVAASGSPASPPCTSNALSMALPRPGLSCAAPLSAVCGLYSSTPVGLAVGIVVLGLRVVSEQAVATEGCVSSAVLGLRPGTWLQAFVLSWVASTHFS